MRSSRTAVRCAISLMIAIIALLGLASEPEASPPADLSPVTCTLEPIEMPKSPGSVQMLLTLTNPMYWCTKVDIRIEVDGNIGYYGETSWSVELEQGKPYSKTLDVVISDNEAGGLKVAISCESPVRTLKRYFVTKDGKVDYWKWEPPGLHPPVPKPPDLLRRGYPNPGEFPDRDTTLGIAYHPDSLTYIRLDLRESAALRNARELLESLTDNDPPGYYDVLVTGRISAEIIKKGIITKLLDPRPWEHDYLQKRLRETDSLGNVIETKKKSDRFDSLGRPIGPIQRFQVFDSLGNVIEPIGMATVIDEFGNPVSPSKSDSAVLKLISEGVDIKTTIELLRMKELEKEPLTDHDAQTINVEGKTYHRKRGEKEFREIEPIIPDDIPIPDSIRALVLAKECKVCLDLRDPDHLKIAQKLIDHLELTDKPGFYHCTITWEIVKKLSSKGIKSRPISDSPHECLPSPSKDDSGPVPHLLVV